jgi:ABC-type multidrug transport system fused ATPase/permease subunit
MNLISTVFEGIGIAIIIPLLEVSVASENEYSTFASYFMGLLNTIGIVPSLKNMLLLMIFVFVIRGITLFLTKYIFIAILVNIQERVRLDLIHRIKKTDYLDINKISSGSLNNILTKEIDVLVKNLKCILTLCSGTITVSLFFLVAFTANTRIALLSIVFGLVIFFMFRGFIKNERQLSRDLVNNNSLVQSYLLQILNNFKYLKATNKFKYLTAHFRDLIENKKKIYLKLNACLIFVQTSIEPLAIIIVSIFIYNEVIVLGSSITEVMLPLMFLYRSLGKVGGLQSSWHVFISTTGSLNEIKKLQERLACNTEGISGIEPLSIKNNISVKNISYRYDEKIALNNISIDLPNKKLIGIVGETGSGKTTFVDIICGLLKPTKGELYWDKMAYSKISPVKLRGHIGYVTQNPVIFNDTVANNITLWRNEKDIGDSLVRLNSIIEQAKCENFINSLPNGLDTIIGDGGITLSGGQCQRIALARELYRKPDLLIIDEGTSAVDAKISAEISVAISEFAKHGTVIMIAHQLSTIKDCDLIIVFEKGEIVKTGSWEELVDNNDWFSQAVDLQNLA